MGHWQLASVLALVLAALGWGSAMAAEAGPRHHVEVSLLAEKSAAEPGKTITVAVQERIDPGWHTYWINPGDSGEPTSIEWSLPEGFSAGPILWPIPHVIPVGPLAEYGYDNEVVLLTEIQVPEKIEGDSVTLSAKVSYLVCREICIPEEKHVELDAPREKRRCGIPIRFCPADRKSTLGSTRAFARHCIVLGEPGQRVAAADGFNGREASQGRQSRSLLPFDLGLCFQPRASAHENFRRPTHAGLEAG